MAEPLSGLQSAPGRQGEDTRAPAANGASATRSAPPPHRRWRAWRRLTPLEPQELPATARVRVSLAAGALVLLAATAVSAVTGWDGGLAGFGTVLFVLGFGVAPALCARTAGPATLTLLSLAVSMSVTVLVGLGMAWTDSWAPTAAFVVSAIVSAIWLLAHLWRDVPALRSGPRDATHPAFDRWQVASGLLALVGLVLTTSDAVANRQAPTPGGLLTIVSPFWYVGIALVLVAALLATLTRRSPGPALLVLSVVVVAGQAIAYNAPTVMSGARHVGVVEFIRAYQEVRPDSDIYQAWAGLFAGAAWFSDVLHVGDPLTTVAAYWPVVLNAATLLAMRVLAGNLGLSRQRAWWAAAIFLFANTLNVTYFSPQSLALFLALTIAALALRVSGARGRALAGQAAALVVLSCALAVTHQISPYLLTLALGVLCVFRLVRPWWPVAAVLVPALAWAAVNFDQVKQYIAPSAVGNVLDNVRPPSLSYNSYEQALVSRVTFGLPVLVLVLVGVLALVAFWQRRDRRSWALLLASMSPIAMAVGSDYGQEAVFRITLFALPWLSILVGQLRLPRVALRPALVVGLLLLVGVNAYGLTGMDWARVARTDEAVQLQDLERKAPDGTRVYLLGSGAASPTRLTERYTAVPYGVLDYYAPGAPLTPAPGSQVDADREIADLTSVLGEECGTNCFIVVSDATAAYNDRYGIQHLEDYQLYADALASSPSWEVYSSGATSRVYRLVAADGGA